MKHVVQSANVKTLVAAVKIAALFHDFGKELAGFQQRLRSKGDLEYDIIRHEVFSYLMFNALTEGLSAEQIRLKFLKPDPTDFDKSAHAIIEKYKELLSKCVRTGKFTALNGLFKQDFAGTGSEFRSNVGLLILTHHRLSHVKLSPLQSNKIKIDAGHYINEVEISLLKQLEAKQFDFCDLYQPTNCVWHNAKWLAELQATCEYSPFSDNIENCSLYGRSLLQISDHLASNDKTISEPTEDICYANTIGKTLADPLSEHLIKVTATVDKTAEFVFSLTKPCPTLKEEDLPSFVTTQNSNCPDRFIWQTE